MIDPVALLKEYHAALNNFDLDRVEHMFAEDAVYVSAGLNGMLFGRPAIMKAMRAYFNQYTDQISIDESIEVLTPNSARSKWRLSATHVATRQETNRKGTEVISFYNNGLINKIEVTDQV
jgi:uncharacterized protein (TIGR02246 family)